jgi:hypothetical protein
VNEHQMHACLRTTQRNKKHGCCSPRAPKPSPWTYPPRRCFDAGCLRASRFSKLHGRQPRFGGHCTSRALCAETPLVCAAIDRYGVGLAWHAPTRGGRGTYQELVASACSSRRAASESPRHVRRFSSNCGEASPLDVLCNALL